MKAPASYISIHLLTVTTLFFIAGIWCVPFISPHFDILPVINIIVVLLFLLIGVFFVRANTRLPLFLLPFCSLLIGYVHGIAHFHPPESNQHIYNLIPKDSEAILTGTLKEMVLYDGKMSKAVVDVNSFRRKDIKFQQPAKGLVRLSLLDRWPENILPGDRIVIRADLKRPRSFHTPGVFDYTRFLAQKDIWVTGYISSSLFIKKLSDNTTITGQYKYLPEKIRTHIGSYLDQTLEPKFASIYKALLLGDRSSVSPSHLELFKASGTFHILAISGLHIAVIASLLYLILYWILSRFEFILLHFQIRKIVAILTIPILLCYALLAGMNSPVTRAVIMSIIVLIALCTDRKKSAAPLVAAAAFIILIFDPLQLFTVSFQLSFAAIIGILFTLPILQKYLLTKEHPGDKQEPLTVAYKYVISALFVSLIATLATAPITISAFNRISTIGPLANLILEPLICLWCLPAGIIALPFIWLSPELANLCLHFGTYGIDSSLYIAKILTLFPFASIYLPDPPLQHILLCFLFLYLCCVKGFKLPRKKTSFLILIAFFLSTLFLMSRLSPKSKQAQKITFIDVGQGSSTLIETNGTTILIDGGGSSFSNRSVGESIIAPFLWDKGISKVDIVIITHPDADHYNGLEYIFDHFSPTTVWVRDQHGHDDKYKDFIARAKKKGIPIKVPRAGNILYKNGMMLQCVANLGGQQFKKTRSGNSANTGLIVKGCFEENCFFFPGDINISMEQFLLQQEMDLDANTLLSAHHGSKTSNSTEFLEAVSPQYTVISAALSKKGYFPHPSFLDKCKALHIEVLNTSQNGAIEFRLENSDTTISTTQRFQNNPLYPLVFITIKKEEKSRANKKPE
ncbi:MAG: competence protein ComEC [Desulforhopalus sp.]